MKEKDKLMTVKEVCQMLKISRITLYRLLATGRLPGFKVGHQWRFRYGEVERYFVSLMQYAPQLFSCEALEHYRAHPEKYTITEDEKGGEIRLIQENQKEVNKQNWFEYFRYCYRSLYGKKVIRLTSHELQILPYEEYVHWHRHRIMFEATR